MGTTLNAYRLSPKVKFSQEQDEFLRTWFANGWLPLTLEQIEAQNDNKVGLTQAHINEFWSDVLAEVRCKSCGIKNFGEDECWMDREEA